MHEFRPPAVVEADAELLHGFRRGDADAVGSLIDRQGAFVYALAAALGGSDRADALTVHVLVQAWRNSEAVAPGSAFRPWLAQLTVRVASHEGVAVAPPAADQLTDEWIDAAIGDEVTWPAPPPELRDDLIAAVTAEAFVAPVAPPRAARGESERAWLRPALVGALATLLFLLVGTVVLSFFGGNEAGDERTVDLQPTGLVEGADGEVTVIDTIDDLRFEYDATRLERRTDGSFYEAWVTTADGELIPLGTFNGGDDVVLTGAVQSPNATELTIGLSAASAAGDSTRVVPVNIVASADLQE